MQNPPQVRGVQTFSWFRCYARVMNELRSDIAAFEDRFRQKLFAKDNKLKGRARRTDLAEMQYRFYRDTWDRMPDFDTLRPETTGKVPTGFFDLNPATRRESIGFVFEGKLRVPAAGRYEFFVHSHRPVELTIGGKDVIGQKTPRRRRLARAIVDLAEGFSDIRLDYFNKEAKEYGLRVWWRPLPESPWRYVTEDAPEGWEKPDFDDSSWKEGVAGGEWGGG